MTGLEPIFKAIFWISAALLFHNYVFFGWTIRFLTLFANRRKTEIAELPSLTVVIAAHNEERFIGETIQGILDQDYPAEKLKIAVGSDVSTDRTEEIVAGFDPSRVTLFPFRSRHGKLGILDTIIPQVESEVVVVMDANVLLAPGALRKLAAGYTDPEVGAVCGYQTVELPDKPTRLREEGSYRSGESRLKERLSRLGVVVGAFGGFYSFRQMLFRQIGATPVSDDIVIPLEVLGQRRRVIFVPDAIGYEEIGATSGEEFQRRVRMTGYNLNALGRAFRLGWRGGLLAFYVVVSYKVLRWLSAYILAVWAISAVALFNAGLIYSASTALIGLALLLAVGGLILDKAGKRAPVFSVAYYFVLMNIALFIGLKRWMTGVQRHWQPRG